MTPTTMFSAAPHRLCSHLINTSRAALARTSVPYTNSALGITSILMRHGLVSNISLGSPSYPAPAEFPSLPRSDQRIWVGLKHRQGQPVLRYLELVSKPSLRKVVTRAELGRLLVGKRARNISGVGTGEILVVKVEADPALGIKGVEQYMEGWEAYRAGYGGEVICRAS